MGDPNEVPIVNADDATPGNPKKSLRNNAIQGISAGANTSRDTG
jgi:hypothetical protein